MQNIVPLVSIHCFTYNHALYIEDAMNGFCMQETTFPFVAIIVDDASADGEPEVIKAYLHKHFDMQNARSWETGDACFIEACHKENQNCTFVVVLLKYNFWQAKKAKFPLIKEWAQTKYVALCEGDDYWITLDKLQIQVGFLDSHPDIGMVYTDYNQLYHTEGRLLHSMIQSGRTPQITDFETHLRLMGYIAPMSWVYRSEFADIAKKYKGKASVDGSFIFALEMFLNSKIHYMDVTTCVYRIVQGSASHKTAPQDIYNYEKGLHETQLYYVNNYSVSNITKESLDWFYEHHAYFIILNDIKDEIKNARNYLKNHKVGQLTFKQCIFNFFMLYSLTTWIYIQWVKIRHRDYKLLSKK